LIYTPGKGTRRVPVQDAGLLPPSRESVLRLKACTLLLALDAKDLRLGFLQRQADGQGFDPLVVTGP
jgi:hypothetical protein